MAAKEKRNSAKQTIDAMVKLEHQAAAEVKSAAKSTGKLAKEHPLATAGVLLGAGVLVGAVAQAAFGHKPTVREAMMDALRSSKKRVAKQMAAMK